MSMIVSGSVVLCPRPRMAGWLSQGFTALVEIPLPPLRVCLPDGPLERLRGHRLVDFAAICGGGVELGITFWLEAPLRHCVWKALFEVCKLRVCLFTVHQQ